MCGIVGIARRSGPVNPDHLVDARDKLKHRGPDDAGFWISDNGCIGMAHRRLAIVDLGPSGHQPMIAGNGRLVVVFNGELYNHRTLRERLKSEGYSFVSNSDTEVLLAAYDRWGDDCLSHFVGMFAFALFDKATQTLFLARDRTGEKPLFYHKSDDGLRFASELKALLVDPALERRVNAEALDCYLAMGFVPADRCILEGFAKLPAAHAMRYQPRDGSCSIWRYWSVPEVEANPNLNENALTEEFQELIYNAVSEQISADVPVGVLLSGGLDSSIVSAVASKLHRGIRTYCVRFPGADGFDESAHASLVARHLGTEHIEVEAGSASADLIPILARQFDEPLSDSSMIPVYLVSEAIRRHCTVALGGDGGDELFGGYHNYSKSMKVEALRNKLPSVVAKLVAATAGSLLPVGYQGRTWLQNLSHNPRDGFPLVSPHFELAQRQRLLGGNYGDAERAETIRKRLVPASGDIIQDATRADFATFLPDDILVKVDRASMHHSLEVRAPFLDHRIVEFAFRSLPSSLKANQSDRKIFLKKFSKPLLPPEFDMVRKQGFTVPLGRWLEAGKYRQLFEGILYDRNGVFDHLTVKKLFDGIDRGLANGERLFSLVLFEYWRREYGISV